MNSFFNYFKMCIRDSEIIEENEEVKIKKIEGVHLIVQKENDKEG